MFVIMKVKQAVIYRHVFCAFFVLLIIGLTGLEISMADPDLSAFVKKNGRLVLAPGQTKGNPDFDSSNLQNLVDDDSNTFMLIDYPAEVNEKTYILVDLGLTHWAPQNKLGGPTSRKAVALKIANGSCLDCAPMEFQQHARLKKIRVDILYRQANNVDQDYKYPQINSVYSTFADLPDHPGVTTIDLSKVPIPLKSKSWPQNMFYIVAKIVIYDIYKEKADQKLAIAEVAYIDRKIQETSDDK